MLATLRAELDSHIDWARKGERITALERRGEDFIRHSRELRALDEQARQLAFDRLNERLEGMNELREQITRERGAYVSRVDVDSRYHEATRRLSELENWKAAQDATKATIQRLSAIIGALAGAAASVLANLFIKR